MSLIGLLFSLLNGLSLACFYMLNKKASGGGASLLVIFAIFLMHMPFLMAWVGTEGIHHVDPSYFPLGLMVAGITVMGNLLTVRALSLSPFSLIVPVLGLSPVFATLLGIPLLQEWPSVQQAVGVLFVVVGVFWLYAPPERPWAVLSFWPQFVRERGAIPIIGAAFMWALGAPMDKMALNHADPSFHALFVFGVVCGVLGWLAFGYRGYHWRMVPWAQWRLLALTGSLGGLAYMTQLLALNHVAAGSFESIKRVVSQLLALAFGCFLFKERLTTPKIIGICILSVGVPLIVL